MDSICFVLESVARRLATRKSLQHLCLRRIKRRLTAQDEQDDRFLDFYETIKFDF